MDLLKILNEHHLWEGEISIKRNEFLVQENTINSNLFFVVKGSLKITCCINENEQIIRLAYKNNIVTALDSFLKNSSTQYAIQAIKSTTVQYISKEKLLHFLTEKNMQKYWIETLNSLVLQQTEREIDLLTNSAKERFQRVIKRSPQLLQEFPHKYIANYLRISPETFSRIIKKY